MAGESKDKWYQKTGDFVKKLPSRSWYVARRVPGHVVILMGSRAYAFALVASVISAGVAASAVWPLAIGVGFLGAKTGIKIYDVMQTRKLEKEANLITEFATRLYHREKIFELVPELSPLKEKLSKIELNNDSEKKRAPVTSNKAMNMFSNGVGMASKSYGIYKIAKNPTKTKVLMQSVETLKKLNAESVEEGSAYQRFLKDLAKDPEEREKLIEFINKHSALEGGYNYSNLQELQEQIQKIKNENQALADVNKGISYHATSSKKLRQTLELTPEQLKTLDGELTPEQLQTLGGGLTSEKLLQRLELTPEQSQAILKLTPDEAEKQWQKSLETKFDKQLEKIKEKSIPPVQETGFQSLMHGIKGAFNPYNPYIITTDKEAEQNVTTMGSDATERKSLDDFNVTLPSTKKAKEKEKLEREALWLKQEEAKKYTITQKIWSGVSYSLETIDKVVDFIFPDDAPSREVKHSGLTLEKKTTIKPAMAEKPVYTARDDFAKGVDSAGLEEHRANFEKNKKMYIEEQKNHAKESKKKEEQKKVKKFQKQIKRIGKAHKAPESEIIKETHKEKVTSSRKKDSHKKKIDVEVSGAPVPRRVKRKSSKKIDNQNVKSPGDLDWVGRSQIKTSDLGRGKSGG